MRKIVYLGWLILFLPAVVFAQGKIEAPVWNVGDKWVFTQGNIEVIGTDKQSYALNFSKGTCIWENMGFETIIFDKSTLNRIYAVKSDYREKYTKGLRRNLHFPVTIGKQWKDAFSMKAIMGAYAGRNTFDYSENFTALGWEDVEVRAGKFKALKLEYKRKQTGSTSGWGDGDEIINQYWYSPNVKYFVKCQYDKDWMKGLKELFNWELTSFQLKK